MYQEVIVMERLIELESLAAKKNISDDDGEFYLTALDEALEDNDNKNIAITGGYGAGKTTIIDSYFDIHKEKAKKMMRVSIATFEAEQDGFDESTRDQNLLEQQILQQMFYQVEPNQIPNSKFTKLSDLSFGYVFRILFFSISIVILTFLTISQGWISQLYIILTGFMTSFFASTLTILVLISLIAVDGILIYILLLVIRKLGISKFGVASTSIEFNLKDGSRVFNHYLDEILYLFNKSQYCYIIFEDLDRFESVKIFERLRGLNTILNSSSQLRDRNIKFIYALKDDIFTHSDETESIYNRTKFFDFIIPTVKIMHSSNAESTLFSKLKKFLKENSNNDTDEKSPQLSRQLIEDVALYINDMRTLINICNEFEIFRFRLNKSSITYDHLFAFIVYKNIYPKDYSDLLENRGIVYDVFHKKDLIIKYIQQKIEYLRSLIVNGLGSIITQKEDLSILFIKKRKLLGRQLRINDHPYISLDSHHYLSAANNLFNYLIKNEVESEISVHQTHGPFIEKYHDIDEFMTIDNINYLEQIGRAHV